MAAKKKLSDLPSPEARAHLIQLVRDSPGPLSAKSLAKLLTPPQEMSATVVMNLLDEESTAGRIFKLPPTTARGAPRFWDRDVKAIIQVAAWEAVQKLELPQSARDLLRTLAVPFKVTEDELVRALEQHVAARDCFLMRPTTAKGKPRYAPFDNLEFGRREIIRVIASKGPQSEMQLKKAVKGLSDAEFQKILDAGFSARQLWRHPPLGKSRHELVGKAPASPSPYLREVGDQLAKIVARLHAVQVPREELRRSLVQLLESAGIDFGSVFGKSADPIPADSNPGDSAQLVDLVALIRRLEPGADRGALVGARDLRRAAHLNKLSFDRAVLDLARAGKLSLHRHDFVASLSPNERDELVTDGAGAYYVGMALRFDGAM
jgi:hypothetical protein